jgi:hypothetical protein
MNDMEILAAERCLPFTNAGSVNLLDVFDEDDTLDCKHLFVAYFNMVPCWTRAMHVDCFKANEWFMQTYRDDITCCHYIKRRPNDGRGKDPNNATVFEDIYYTLFDDLLMYFNCSRSYCSFLFRKTSMEKVQQVIDGVKQFKEREKKMDSPRIYLLVNSSHGIDTQTMKISRPKLTIEDNYNDDFLSIHQTIFKRLQRRNDKGLVLLHGKPGTGKTSYIRYLITKVKKDVIFLPPNMAAAITNPDLMRVLIDNPNSIFVIEDAENIIIDRNRSGASPVSALLNMADGLLSDCLNIQIVCSFNTDLSRVDDALLRKGRLIAKYEFLELEAVKAQALSTKLGFASRLMKPMTLAAIYNQAETDFHPITRKAMGF